MRSIAIAGLGRSGADIARRLLAKGFKPAVWNSSPEKMAALAGEGASPAATLTELVSGLKAPRAVWLALPAGEPTEKTFLGALSLLEPGDLIIDGGEGDWRDAVRRSEKAAAAGMDFLDAGVSGGVWGLANGYCITAGGAEAACEKAEPFFKALCREGGYLRCGGPGAGHYARMAHDGIESALLRAYGEGFALLKASPYGGLDLAALAAAWNRGSALQSWLLELAQNAFDKDPGLEQVSGSQLPEDFGDRLSAALRREYAGSEG